MRVLGSDNNKYCKAGFELITALETVIEKINSHAPRCDWFALVYDETNNTMLWLVFYDGTVFQHHNLQDGSYYEVDLAF